MKEYPIRTKTPSLEEQNKLYDICSCGHAYFDHRIECGECMCPKFEFEQQLTMNQLAKLGMIIERNADVRGFKQ